jgi:glycine betaine catabolism B
MKKFTCTVCGFVYEPGKGLPESGIPPGTPFEALPADFCCPMCGADKSCFSPLGSSEGDAAQEPLQLQATVQEVVSRTPSIKSFRFAIPNRASFKAGQYLSITLENDVELTRYLSISSSPTEQGCLEVTKRITQSRFSQILNQIAPGYQVSIRYPMGTFTFDGDVEKVAMLSGGIGITPLRSMCRYIIDRQLGTSVSLLYSNRNLAEIAFKSEFDAMQRMSSRFKVVHSLTSADDQWTGRRGRIDAALVRQEVPDYRERRFYVCGPPGMVNALTEVLRGGLQLPEAQVKTEAFLGY